MVALIHLLLGFLALASQPTSARHTQRNIPESTDPQPIAFTASDNPYASSALNAYESALEAQATDHNENQQNTGNVGNSMGYSTVFKIGAPTGHYDQPSTFPAYHPISHNPTSTAGKYLTGVAAFDPSSSANFAAGDGPSTSSLGFNQPSSTYVTTTANYQASHPLQTEIPSVSATSADEDYRPTSEVTTEESDTSASTDPGYITSSSVTAEASTSNRYPSGVVAYEQPTAQSTVASSSIETFSANAPISLFSSGTIPYGNPTMTDHSNPPLTSQAPTRWDQEECIDTSIIPLASSLSSSAQNCTECFSCDSDCEVFVQSLASCQDDTCACGLTYQAQLCAQCLSLESAVQEYNLYLSACSLRGMVQPTETLTAECEDATETSDVLTDMLASQAASATATARTTGGIMGQVGVQMPDGNSSNATQGGVSTISTTDSDGQPRSIVTYLGSTSGTTTSGVTSSGQSTSALDSSVSFFSTSIDSTCSQQCEYWYELAQTCTDDSCICTPDSMESAKLCASCVISSNSNDQMRGYAGFTQGCASAPTASSGGITTDPSGVIGVAAAATSTQPTRSSEGSNPFDDDGGSATGAVKTRVAEHQGADGIASVMADDSSASSLSLAWGLGGTTWIVTGLTGGLLIVYVR